MAGIAVEIETHSREEWLLRGTPTRLRLVEAGLTIVSPGTTLGGA